MVFELDFLVSYDKDSIAAELRRVAKKLRKRTLTHKDINGHARVCSNTVKRRFGSMQLAHEAAGLVPPKGRLSDAEILTLLADLWKITHKKWERSPTVQDLKKYRVPVCVDTVVERFGTWNKALVATALAASGRLKTAVVKPKPAKRKRSMISIRRRFLVFKRDRYRCRICRRVGGELEIDHVVPFCRGGRDSVANLQTLCKKCNRGKRGSLQ